MTRVDRSRLQAFLGWLVVVAVLWAAAPARAQHDLGHKLLGSLGPDAGVQRDVGLYVADRLAYYYANSLIDRNGVEVPEGLDIDGLSNSLGVGLTLEFSSLHTFYNAAVSASLGHVRTSTERPEAHTNRFGLGDLYVQPFSLGWRLSLFDIVVGYAFYAPIGRSLPGGHGVSSGHWTQEFSFGGAIFLDDGRRWRLSALGTYDWNHRSRDVDITRGNTIQVQGGLGGPVHPNLIIGLVGYGLWQVQDDKGADVPSTLVGARDIAWGLGAEVSVQIPPIRGRITTRYVHDVFVRTRPFGGLLSLEFSVAAWLP